MRIAGHIATLAAVLALSLAFGRWLREPNAGGLIFLLLLVAATAVAVRRIYRSPARDPAPAPARAPEPEPEPEPEPPLWDHRIDLNRADAEALQRLPGVGPVAAQRIVIEREANGPFESVQALTRVPGFGPAKVRVLASDARV
jgi:competence ComEA-like helix-hairpin-helix protein